MTPETKRGRGRPPGTVTLEQSLGTYFVTRANVVDPPADDGTTWPSKKYQHDIIAFFTDVLGVEYILPTQRKILLAIQHAAHHGGRVAVKAGRKVSKTYTGAGAALWFYCSFDDAHVWLTATKIDQIDDQVWLEIRKAHRTAKIPIDGSPAVSSETGLVALDDRSIKGRVTRTQEGGQGYSGRQFYIVDEATGVEQFRFDAIEGNRAGGAVPMLILANPTKTEGEFFDAFHSKISAYGGGDPGLGPFTISSEESPNFIEGKIVVPGMATREWIQEMEKIHGRDSAFFQVHVLGKFAEGEFGKIVKLASIIEAQKRWYGQVDERGPLVIGLDVAGSGPGGDDTVFAPRRGQRVRIHDHSGLTTDGICKNLLDYIEMYANAPREEVLVVVDAEGEIGAEMVGKLRHLASIPKNRFRLYAVRAGKDAERAPRVYVQTRDELWAAAATWLANGGAIPDDAELAQELHAPSWLATEKNRQYATKKKDLKKLLGRSPDKADALCLAVWLEGHEHEPSPHRYEQGKIEELRNAVIDPFDADRALDPYKGMV